MLLRLLGILLLVLALLAAWMRAPERPVEALVGRWAPAPSEFIDLQGQLVHLRDEGPREDPLPLVLLHGTSASLHTWEGWVQGLSRTRRVITLDLPGFGLTGPFTGVHPAFPADDYRGDSLARFVWAVLDARGVGRVVVGGNSMGGEVAWRAATLAPSRVAGLVLVDSSGTAFVPQSMPLGFHLVRLPGVRWLAQYFTPRALVAQGLRNSYGDPAKVSPSQIDRYHELLLRQGNRRALALRMSQLERGEHVARLAALRMPALILWGERDRLIPPDQAQQLAQALGGPRRVVVLPGVGHVPQEEDPAASLAALKPFLAEIR
jgi:pimeloyl-ACP methyl ester carboxylesterase